MPLKHLPAVYCIENTTNGKKYVGSTRDAQKRWQKHKSHLRTGTHHTAHLQAAWKKYEAKGFLFVVIEYFTSDIETRLIREREQYYKDSLHPEYCSRNMIDLNLGVKHSEASRKLMSTTLKLSWQKNRQHRLERMKEHTARGAFKRTGNEAPNPGRFQKGQKPSPEHIAKLKKMYAGVQVAKQPIGYHHKKKITDEID